MKEYIPPLPARTPADYYCCWIGPLSGRHCGRTGIQGPLFEIFTGAAPDDVTTGCVHHIKELSIPHERDPEFHVIVEHIRGTGMTVYGLIQRLSLYDPDLPLAQNYLGEHELLDIIASGGTDDKAKLLCFQFGASPVSVDFDPPDAPPPPARVAEVYVIFDGPPSHESGRFIEVETADGKAVGFHNDPHWEQGQPGYTTDVWRLGPFLVDPDQAKNPEAFDTTTTTNQEVST